MHCKCKGFKHKKTHSVVFCHLKSYAKKRILSWPLDISISLLAELYLRRKSQSYADQIIEDFFEKLKCYPSADIKKGYKISKELSFEQLDITTHLKRTYNYKKIEEEPYLGPMLTKRFENFKNFHYSNISEIEILKKRFAAFHRVNFYATYPIFFPEISISVADSIVAGYFDFYNWSKPMFYSPRGHEKDKIYPFPILKQSGSHLVFLKGTRKIVIDVKTGKKTTFTIPPCLATNAVGNIIATLNPKRTEVYLYNYFKGKCYRVDTFAPTLEEFSDFITKVGLSDDGALLAMTIKRSQENLSEHNRLVVFDVQEKKLLYEHKSKDAHDEQQLKNEEQDAFCLDFGFSPNSQDLVAVFSAAELYDAKEYYHKQPSLIKIFNFKDLSKTPEIREFTFRDMIRSRYFYSRHYDSSRRLQILDKQILYCLDGPGANYYKVSYGKIELDYQNEEIEKKPLICFQSSSPDGSYISGALEAKLVDSQNILFRSVGDCAEERISYRNKSVKLDSQSIFDYCLYPDGSFGGIWPFKDYFVYIQKRGGLSLLNVHTHKKSNEHDFYDFVIYLKMPLEKDSDPLFTNVKNPLIRNEYKEMYGMKKKDF